MAFLRERVPALPLSSLPGGWGWASREGQPPGATVPLHLCLPSVAELPAPWAPAPSADVEEDRVSIDVDQPHGSAFCA